MPDKYTGQIQSFWSNVPEGMKNPKDVLYLGCAGFIVGILAGGVVSLFRLAKDSSFSAVLVWTAGISSSPTRIACLFLGAFAAAIVVSLLIRNPAIRLGGEDWIKKALDEGQRQPWLRILAPKFLGSWLVLTFGISVGSEGPSIQMGAASALGLKKIYSQSIERRYFILGGCAAGLAAAFSAPFAGIFYIYEVMREKLDSPLIIFMLGGSVGVYFATSYIVGPNLLLPLAVGSFPGYSTLLLLLPLTVLAAFTGICYHYLLRLSLEAAGHQKLVPGFLLPCAAFLGAAVMLLIYPNTTGEGLSILPGLEHAPGLISALCLLFAVKMLFTAFCYGTGIPAGVMVPVLCLGAVIALIYTVFLHSIGIFSPEMLPVCLGIGMCGAFAASERAPLTATVLVAEMTGAYAILVPMLITAAISTFISRLCRVK